MNQSLLDVSSVGPTIDVVQDHPAVWDWRVVVLFVALGLALLYLL